jgi:hypothetical protein
VEIVESYIEIDAAPNLAQVAYCDWSEQNLF